MILHFTVTVTGKLEQVMSKKPSKRSRRDFRPASEKFSQATQKISDSVRRDGRTTHCPSMTVEHTMLSQPELSSKVLADKCSCVEKCHK